MADHYDSMDLSFLAHCGEFTTTVTPNSANLSDVMSAFIRFLRSSGFPNLALDVYEDKYVILDEADEVIHYEEGSKELEPLDFSSAISTLEEALEYRAPAEDSYEDFLTSPVFAVGDLVELKPGEYHFAIEQGVQVRVTAVEDEGIRWDKPGYIDGAWGYAFRFRKVTEEPKASETPRDLRTGLAIPAPGFPWSANTPPAVLPVNVNPFKVGDRVRSIKFGGVGVSVAKLGCPVSEGREHDCVTYTGGGWDRVADVELVPEEPKEAKATNFKQGDIVKVVRVTHPDDRKFLDAVGPVLGWDPAHTNGQTVHVSFWDHTTGEETPWWVHHDSLFLAYRPGSSS